MKRWLCAILVVCLVALPSCASQPKETYGGVPCPVDKLQWGMTPEEALTALGVPLDTKRYEYGEKDDREVTIHLPENLEIYGGQGKVTLYFYEQYRELQGVGLVSLEVLYEKETPEDELRKRIEEEAAPYVDFDDFWWKSKKRLKDMPDEAVHRYLGLDEEDWEMYWDWELGNMLFVQKNKDTKETYLAVNNFRAVVLHKGLQKMEMDK